MTGLGRERVVSMSMCGVCHQHIYFVDGEWIHKLSGVQARQPVRHKATPFGGEPEPETDT